MPDPTAEELQKQKDAEIARLTEEKRKADERVANAEKKFNEWSNEVGGIRKIGESLTAALEDAKKSLKETQDLIADLKAGRNVQQAPGGKLPGNNAGGAAQEETLEDVEKALDENQRKVVEVAFAQLTDAEKLQFQNDLEFRIAFLKRAQDAAPTIPASPWKTAPKKSKPGDESGSKTILDRVFDKKRQNRFVPPGPHGGAPVLGDPNQSDAGEPQEDSRVH
jgi:chromosome segregation ATPase